MTTIFPRVALQQQVSSVSTRPVQPSGHRGLDVVWRHFGFGDDDQAMTRRRLTKAEPGSGRLAVPAPLRAYPARVEGARVRGGIPQDWMRGRRRARALRWSASVRRRRSRGNEPS